MFDVVEPGGSEVLGQEPKGERVAAACRPVHLVVEKKKATSRGELGPAVGMGHVRRGENEQPSGRQQSGRLTAQGKRIADVLSQLHGTHGVEGARETVGQG